MAVKTFLGVQGIRCGYLEGPPRSGLSNAPTFMVIRRIAKKISPIFDFFLEKKLFRGTLLNLTSLSSQRHAKAFCFCSSRNFSTNCYILWVFNYLTKSKICPQNSAIALDFQQCIYFLKGLIMGFQTQGLALELETWG